MIFWTVIVAIQPSDIVIDRHILAHYFIDSTGHNIEISPTHEEILQPGFEWLIDTVWVWVEKVTNCTIFFLEHCGCVDGQSLDALWCTMMIIANYYVQSHQKEYRYPYNWDSTITWGSNQESRLEACATLLRLCGGEEVGVTWDCP